MSYMSTEAPNPVVIDTRINELRSQHAALASTRQYKSDTIHEIAGDTRRQLPRDISARFASGAWQRTIEDVLDIDPATLNAWDERRYTETVANYSDLTTRIDVVCAEITDLDAIYRAHHWSRFYLVTNVGGHIHRAENCGTCYPTTEFAWQTHLSGRTDAEALADLGPRLCSICFPGAPVEHTNGELHATRQEREARAAERDTKRTAKQDKALAAALFEGEPERYIRNPDGIGSSSRIATIAQAKAFIKGSYTWAIGEPAGYSHPSYPPAAVTAVAEALSARTGTPVADLLADAKKKAEASYRREARLYGNR
jgi:hypothetical protein